MNMKITLANSFDDIWPNIKWYFKNIPLFMGNFFNNTSLSVITKNILNFMKIRL